MFTEPKVGKAYIYSFKRRGIYTASIDAIKGMSKDEIAGELPEGEGRLFTINDFINYLTYVGASINGLSFPAFVSLEVTAKCNLSCRHCYVRAAKPSGVEVPSSAWAALIGELAGKAVMVEISGGEPLLKEGMEDILRAAKRADLVVKLVTNGTLLEEKLPALLKILDRETDLIQVSIDGTGEVHDGIRGKGSYRKAMKGISKASKYFKVVVSYTLMKANLGVTVQTYRAVAKAGASLFKVALCRPVGACEGLVPLSALFKEVRKLMSLEDEVGLPVFPRHVKGGTTPVDLSKPLYTCPAAISALSIAYNGDAYPCIMFRPHLRLGNVFEEDVDAVWGRAGSVRTLLLRDLSKTKCVRCPYVRTCMGGCPAMAYHAHRTTSIEDPQCDLRTR